MFCCKKIWKVDEGVDVLKLENVPSESLSKNPPPPPGAPFLLRPN